MCNYRQEIFFFLSVRNETGNYIRNQPRTVVRNATHVFYDCSRLCNLRQMLSESTEPGLEEPTARSLRDRCELSHLVTNTSSVCVKSWVVLA